jgi:hypothetical protein
MSHMNDNDDNDYNDYNDDNDDNTYESPCKKMKYEEEYVTFQTGYITKKCNILLQNKEIEHEHEHENEHEHDSIHEPDDNKILRNFHNIPFELNILHFQTGEGYDLYLLVDNLHNDVNKTYSIIEIFNNFLKGDYLIGTLQHYGKNKYCNGIIDNLSKFNDDVNEELKLHYTQPRCYSGNVAWRTINWDLFEQFVPKEN